MYNVLDYNEPYIRAPSPATVMASAWHKQARQEALARQRQKQQEQAKREAVQLRGLQVLSQAIKEAAEEEERQRIEAAVQQFFGWRR